MLRDQSIPLVICGIATFIGYENQNIALPIKESEPDKSSNFIV